ncbi:DNA-directed RNA polymerase subunit delta [Sporosarcina sp. E16_3]|uniref:DNA-directed RNA polymerase subunit delta n=1 Tax=Sporosarcina sp. E16_3 TaxID=2789293 RepID=UPI001A91A6ED|nr:DNA-directed RNA polymerase subunit delta [Sporosarcina sp. E16_3]MBO0601112.1 DNA-directed RNA polymerase subunit delta [Sporosarcina sp. E16_3]
MNIREMTKEQLFEESMIDIAYAVLAERKEPLTLLQLMDAIRKLNGVTERVMRTKLQQFYTDMNIDGRFLAINDNRWGLREWYPVDQIEVETAPVVKVRKKKKKKALLEDDDIIDDEDDEDELFDEEFDELIDEDDEDDDEDDDDEEEEEEVVEIEVDLIDPDDELEIIPDDADLELDEEDEEEEDEDEIKE